MYLNLYEQQNEKLEGNSVAQFATTAELPEYVAIDARNGPAFCDIEQVQKLIHFLQTWVFFRQSGGEPNPLRPIYEAGR